MSMYRDVSGEEVQLQHPAPDPLEVSSRNPLLHYGTVSPRVFPSMLFSKIQHGVEGWSLFLTMQDANTGSYAGHHGGVVTALLLPPALWRKASKLPI